MCNAKRNMRPSVHLIRSDDTGLRLTASLAQGLRRGAELQGLVMTDAHRQHRRRHARSALAAITHFLEFVRHQTGPITSAEIAEAP